MHDHALFTWGQCPRAPRSSETRTVGQLEPLRLDVGEFTLYIIDSYA